MSLTFDILRAHIIMIIASLANILINDIETVCDYQYSMHVL